MADLNTGGPLFTILHHLDGDPLARPSREVYAEVMDHVVLADELGFDTVWFAEHHGAQGGRLPSPLLYILQAAERTRRIRLGTGVTLLPFRHPFLVAEEVAQADIQTGGRFALGVGSGSAPADFATFNVAPPVKGERLREGLDILLRAWTGEPFSYYGRHYTIENARLFPTPEQSPGAIVWVAAGHTFIAGLAGARGLHLMLARGTAEPDALRLLATYNTALDEAGHARHSRFMQRTWIVYVDETDEQARQAVAPAARWYYAAGRGAGRPAVTDENDLDALLTSIDCIAGSPATVARELARRGSRLGLTHIALHTRLAAIPHQHLLRSTELLAREVAPEVRRQWVAVAAQAA